MNDQKIFLKHDFPHINLQGTHSLKMKFLNEIFKFFSILALTYQSNLINITYYFHI